MIIGRGLASGRQQQRAVCEQSEAAREERILYGDCAGAPGALNRVEGLLKWLSFIRKRGSLPLPRSSCARYYYYKELRVLLLFSYERARARINKP